VQAVYAAQINLGSSTLLTLGMDESKLSLAWLAGPISGLIMQPVIGVLSDNCTARLGKRRPFLIGGGLLTTASLLAFSNAQYISPSYPLPLAVFSFFCLDFSVQAIQGPLRALIIDVAPGDLLPVGNSHIGLFTGMGNLLGSLLASRHLTVILPFFASDTQALFAIVASVLVLCITVCCFSVSEVPLVLAPPVVLPPHQHPHDFPVMAPNSAPSTAAVDLAEAALESGPLGISQNMDFQRSASSSSFILPRNTSNVSSPVLPPLSSIFRVTSSPSMWSLGIGPSASIPSLRSRLLGRNRPSVPGPAPSSMPLAWRLTPEQEREMLLSNEAARAADEAAGESMTTNMIRMLRDVPRPFWRVFCVQLFTWFGFFSLFVFVNAWVGTNVYLGRGMAPAGSESRELFDEGVRLGGVGNALTALITVLVSPMVTPMLERFGILRTYALSQLIEASCLISAHFIRGVPGQSEPSALLKLATIIDISAFGWTWAITIGGTTP
jgi:MFS/sugar transport protein